MFGSRRAKEAAGSTSGLQSGSAEPTMSPSQDVHRAAESIGDKTQAGTQATNSEEAQRRTAIAIRQSLAFAQINSVLMRSPHYKHHTLTDLEWLVPPLLTGQFSAAEAGPREGGARFPVAVVLWASVSVDVDKRLTENPAAPIRLRPDEWRSGNILIC